MNNFKNSTKLWCYFLYYDFENYDFSLAPRGAFALMVHDSVPWGDFGSGGTPSQLLVAF